jgi:hypothetical protein
VLGQQLAQRAVVDAGPGVVGLQPSWSDVVRCEELQGALDEGGDGLGLLVGVDLGEGQAGVVIDDRVGELPARPLVLLFGGAVGVARDAMPGTVKGTQTLGIHLRQIARAAPLEPSDGLARRPWHPRHAAASETA